MVNIQTEGFPDGPGPAPPPPTPLTLIHDISQHLRYYVQDKLETKLLTTFISLKKIFQCCWCCCCCWVVLRQYHLYRHCSSAPVLQCESSINWFQLSTEHHQQQDSLCSACWHDGCWSRWEDNCTILSLTIILNTTPTSSSNDNYWVPLHLSYLISPACLSTMVLCSASHT